MSQQYPGGFVTYKDVNASSEKASGIWTLDQAMQYNKAGKWPGQSLYAFTTFNFTNASATGQNGPTLAQCLSSYNTTTYPWLSNTSYFNVSGGIQYWTVPSSGNYTINAYGAKGGNSTGGSVGGSGSSALGTFTLVQGEIIRILVGQMGTTGSSGGGGGGTFVVRTPYNTTGSILVIAGGGGGAADGSGTSLAGVAAPITNSGTAGADGTLAGGTGGAGGTGASGAWSGGGGGGFTGSGGNAMQSNTQISNSGGQAFTSGGTGGSYSTTYNYGQVGGFGGGAGASWGAAGGGGYSGGGADYSAGGGGDKNGGGGGGLYNSGTNQTNTAGVNAGHGYVVVTKLQILKQLYWWSCYEIQYCDTNIQSL